MSQQRYASVSKTKIHGQVFTPLYTVKEMLNRIEYTASNPDILRRKVMEPSFGKGVFLKEVTTRLISAAQYARLAPDEISKLLDQNIYGIELDSELHSQTIRELTSLCENHGLHGVTFPHLSQGNALDWRGIAEGQFDYVVGNPPYVRIHNIDPANREKVKRFEFTTGTTDLYVAFFELAAKMLAEGGRMAFITPNSFMKNTSQKALRSYLIKNRMLVALTDYGSSKIFPDAFTYATITYLTRPAPGNPPFGSVEYLLRDDTSTFRDVVSYESLTANPGEAWNFADVSGVIVEQGSKRYSFAELAHVQGGVSTLRDKLFTDLSPAPSAVTGCVTFNGFPVEKGILRPVVKGSIYRGEEVVGRILFPYVKNGSRYVPLDETTLSQTYPHAYAYLLSHRHELEQRSMEANASTWYQFGRSQSLSMADAPKLVMSSVIRPGTIPEVYTLPKGTIVTSSFFMVPHPDVTAQDITRVVSTADFLNYARAVGKDMSGNYVSLSAKNIKHYRFDLPESPGAGANSDTGLKASAGIIATEESSAEAEVF